MAHFILVTYPLPGSINPSLQLAKHLVRTGAHVTYLIPDYAHRRMIKSPTPDGLSYATFSDGFADTPKPTDDRFNVYLKAFTDCGQEALADILSTLANERRPATCVMYTTGLPWPADVARTFRTPAVLLWIQPATVFAIYYHYFHGYDDFIAKSIEKDPHSSINLPGLPPLTSQELPSFLLPSDLDSRFLPLIRKHFEALDKEEKPRVVINTFDEAERDAIQAVDGVDQITVGPLVPPALLDGEVGSDATYGVQMFQDSRNYIEWLDSKPASSVVYVSFGSIVVPPENQTVEILNGLVESGRPFLWVISPTKTGEKSEFWKRANAAEERGEGMIVPWCSQAEVLFHPSVGCFVSHCGWNSTTESLLAGVPMVCLPNFTDQTTNAKLVEDIWKAGARAKANREGVFEAEELKRCLDLVIGREKGDEIRRNAVRWGDLARAAVKEGGSSDRNIRAFLAEMRCECGAAD